MRFAVAILLMSTVAHAKTVAYGVAIGNNAPPLPNTGGAAPLRYADDDAVRYFELFRRLGDAYLLTALDADTQRRYPGLDALAEAPTLSNLRKRVALIATKMRADRARGDEPVFYLAFSGHGADARGEPFLSLLDGPLTQTILYDEILAQLPGSVVHLLVDACNANAVVGARGDPKELDAQMESLSPGELRAFAQKRTLARFPFVGAIVSTTSGEQAHEWSRLESGVFTHEVLSALSGAADVNGDGRIEYSEVQAFVSAANRQLHDPRAMPKIIASPPAFNRSAPIVTLRSLKDVTLLDGNFSTLGRFYLELENGERYADAHLETTHAELVVPTGAVAYLVTAEREAEIHPNGARLRVEDLRFGLRHDAERGAIDTAYREGLFAEAFGEKYYRGFVDSANLPSVAFVEKPRTSPDSRRSARRRTGVALLGLSSALGVAAVATGGLSFAAKRDFDATSYQREGYDASHRFDAYAWSTGITASLSLILGVTGTVLLTR